MFIRSLSTSSLGSQSQSGSLGDSWEQVPENRLADSSEEVSSDAEAYSSHSWQPRTKQQKLTAQIACAWQEALRNQWKAIMVRSLDESKFISALANPAGVCCVVSQKSNVDFVASLKTATVQTEGLTSSERWLLEAFCSANSQLGITAPPYGHQVLRLTRRLIS
jgi:hypothetical protein